MKGAMTAFDPYGVLVRPLLTERSIRLREIHNQYFFEVRPDAAKPDIRRAVEELFKVNVLAVRTMTVRGKVRRMGRHSGRRPDWKKAVVTLAGGQKIDVTE